MTVFDRIKRKKHQIFPGMTLAVFLLFSGSGINVAGYDFFVDANSAEAAEDGSEQHPFKTISATMDYIREKKLDNKNVFIKNGTYSETVMLINDTNLTGEDRHQTVINADGKSYGILFRSTNSQVSNLTVEKAGINAKVNKKSKAVITNCSFKNSGSNGLEVDRSSYSERYKFIFRDSSVKESGKRGIYAFQRKIEIRNSEVEGNEGEGIDLHSRLRGNISGNTIRSNNESGIEMIMSGTKISIKGNTILGNKTQGLTIQVYNETKGKIKISKNTIASNSSYGIRYARYDHGKMQMKFQDFIKQCVKLSGNSISGNDGGDYGYL